MRRAIAVPVNNSYETELELLPCKNSACGAVQGPGLGFCSVPPSALGTLTALLPVNARRYDTRIGVGTRLGMLTAVNGTIECTAL